MSLTLDFDGQLLIGDIGTVDVHLNNGAKLSVVITQKPARRIPRTIPDTEMSDTLGFFIEMRHLPPALQTHIRETINKEQKKVHDKALKDKEDFVNSGGPVLRRVPARYETAGRRTLPPKSPLPKFMTETPPQTVEILPSYPLIVRTLNTWNGHPTLRVGEQFIIRPRGQFKELQFALDTITGFIIRPPH